LRRPELVIVDGAQGLEKALAALWSEIFSLTRLDAAHALPAHRDGCLGGSWEYTSAVVSFCDAPLVLDSSEHFSTFWRCR
jgi:hypothetical protein